MARSIHLSAALLLASVFLLAIISPSYGNQNLSSKHCRQTFRNCERCTSGFKACVVCEYGYKLDSRTRKICSADLSGSKCTRSFWKCLTCNSGFRSCKVCAYGYKPNSQGRCCEDLSGRKCRSLFPNCATCAPGFRGCRTCVRGFSLKPYQKTCKPTQQPEDLSGPKCKALDANCATCTAGFKACASCVTDYKLDTTTKKCVEDLSGPKCSGLFTNCESCTPGFQSCATCLGTFILNPVTKKCEDKKGVDFDVTPAAGGSGELPGVARVSFPGDSFGTTIAVHMEVVADSFAENLYTDTAVFFQPQQRGPTSGIITVTVRDQQPTKDPTVKIIIPSAMAAAADPTEEARLMYLNHWESDFATLDTWEITDDRASPVATVGSITVTLPFTAFYQSASGDYVASLLLITTNTAAGVTANDGGNRRRMLLQSTAVCDGVSLTRPVADNFPIPPRGHYGPRKLDLKAASAYHRGLDFAAPSGTPVYAAHDGTVELRSQGPNKGWGNYIIVKGAAGTTLYGHLPPHADGALVKTGDAVKAGDQLGVSGNSGTSTNPHLHFEYAPDGKIFNKDSKVDPEPCLDVTAVGSISVGDNGPAADDSFEVQLRGQFLCQTSIGATNTCTLGALRKGTYSLAITCLVAPDNVGTLGVSVLAANMKIDGASSVSANMFTNQIITYTLTVT